MSQTTLPSQYAHLMRAIQEIEAASLIASLSQDCRRVLNVGPSWGRDYYALTQGGHEVFNLDVAYQAHLPRLVVGNVAQAVPFPDKTFDAVVMAEVLEHIWNDFDALREARRVLRDNGRLIVTVPFYHDVPEYHVRIHSPRTIHRLLAANGFQVTDYIERGGLITWPRLVHGLRKIVGAAVSKTVVRCDEWLGRRRSWLLRLSPGYGCYVAAVKSQAVDFEQMNVAEFRH